MGRFLAIVCLTTLLTACSSPTETSPVLLPAAFVHGVVLDQEGGAVADAEVEVRHQVKRLLARGSATISERTRTAPDGTYGRVIRSWFPGVVVVSVRIEPAAGSGLAAAEQQDLEVELPPGTHRVPPSDTLRADFVLRPARD